MFSNTFIGLQVAVEMFDVDVFSAKIKKMSQLVHLSPKIRLNPVFESRFDFYNRGEWGYPRRFFKNCNNSLMNRDIGMYFTSLDLPSFLL